jgi:hypothetical protein
MSREFPGDFPAHTGHDICTTCQEERFKSSIISWFAIGTHLARQTGTT